MSYLIGILLIVIIFLMLAFKQRKKQLDLRSRRRGYTSDDFCFYFAKEGIPSEFSKKVYEYLQSLLGVKSVPIKPDDDLRVVLGIGEGGGVLLEDIIDDLIGPIKNHKWYRNKMDLFATINGWSGNVEDLVKLLFFLSQHQKEHEDI